MFRRLTARQLAVDLGIAVVCVLLRWAIAVDVAALWLVVLGMALALAIRRLSPGLALTVAWATAIAQMALLLAMDGADVAVVAVLYTTSRYGGPLTRWAGFASAIVGALVATAYVFFVSPALERVSIEQRLAASVPFVLSGLAVFLLSWTLGLLAKTWRTASDSRIRQREAEAAFATELERNRIARDMHDVVAHSLAVVIAQADGARYSLTADPASVETALSTIATVSREALGDVRVLLGQLRHGQDAPAPPVVADFDDLVEQLRASGLDVVAEGMGALAVLPPELQLAVYRIAQEALTNALRHGEAGGRVLVSLTASRDAAHVRITNPVRGAGETIAASGPISLHGAHGHGISGMRERAMLIGGSLEVERSSGKFDVVAQFPLAGAAL